MSRLLLVVPAFLPERIDGTTVTTWELAKAYVRQGHEVTVLCRATGPEVRQAALPTAAEDQLRETSLRVVRLPPARLPELPLPEDHETIRQFTELLEQWAPQAVQFHHLETLPPALPRIARERGLPTVMTLHDFYMVCPTTQLLGNGGRNCPGPEQGRRCARCYPATPKVLPFRDGTSRQLIRLKRLFSAGVGLHQRDFIQRHHRLAELLTAADLQFTVTSHFSAERLQAVAGQPLQVQVIPNGSDLDYSPRPLAQGGVPTIGFMGTMARVKGPHLLTTAMRGLLGAPWRLELHGDGDRGYVEQLLQGLPPQRCHHHGAYAPGQAAAILSRLDLLVMPSLVAENCPLVLLQALAAGVPCLVAGWGGMAELITPGREGWWFMPGDAGDLRQVLAGLLDDPRQILAVADTLTGRPARRWDRVASEHLALLCPL